ncbi:MAG: hypothetical protein ACK5M7_03470 [Draconibacterium sp.]
MKQIFFLSFILLILIAFSSCDTTEVSTTTLSIKVPVAVEDTTSTVTKSEIVGYPFSGSLTDSLTNNEFLDNLKSLKIEDFYVNFKGIQNNQSIDTINISVEGVGIIATLEDITSSNLAPQPEINSSILVLIGNILRAEQQLTVSVSGTTNAAPMNFVVETYFVLSVETSL